MRSDFVHKGRGSTSPEDCIECPSAMVPNRDKNGCMKCKDDEYVMDGKCLPDPTASS